MLLCVYVKDDKNLTFTMRISQKLSVLQHHQSENMIGTWCILTQTLNVCVCVEVFLGQFQELSLASRSDGNMFVCVSKTSTSQS